MKRKNHSAHLLLSAAVGLIWFGCIGMSRAGVIVDYNFSANPYPATQPTNVAPTTLASDIISSAIDSGTGTGGVGAGNGGGSNGTGLSIDYTNPGGSTYPNDFLRAFTAATTGTQTTEAQAVATASYWNFIVTPTAGAVMDFSDISITGARGGGSQPRGFYIESSIDNPGNTWGTADIFGIGSEQSQRPSLTTYNVGDYTTYETGGANQTSLGVGSLNLATNPAYQNVSTPVEFRVYVIGPASGNSIDFTDLSINGTVVTVPEPSSMTLLGLSSLGLCWYGLRNRRRATC